MDTNLNETLQELMKSVQRIEQKLDAVGVLEKSDSKVEGISPSTAIKKVSAKEFFLDKKPEGAVQTTLASGYYLEQFDQVGSFNKDDIERVYRLAKMTPPTNINDKVNMCIRSGYMMEAEEKKDSKKAWVLTALGEGYVEGGFIKNK